MPDRSARCRPQYLKNSTTGLKYNLTTASAWFDYTCTPIPNATKGTTCKGAGRHQVHFDTNHSLGLKLKALRKAGARGVAWWNTGSVEVHCPPAPPAHFSPSSTAQQQSL